jgi:hypothetical protein
MVNQYLDSKPDPQVCDFLRHNFDDLTNRYSGVVGTTFRAFPSYPQRYTEVVQPQPAAPPDVNCRVEPLRVPRVTTAYTEDDLITRQFLRTTTRRATDDFRAA